MNIWKSTCPICDRDSIIRFNPFALRCAHCGASCIVKVHWAIDWLFGGIVYVFALVAIIYSIVLGSVWPFFAGIVAIAVSGMFGKLVPDQSDDFTMSELKRRGKNTDMS